MKWSMSRPYLSWSLTKLPFALALVTPRTKLVLSSARRPFWYEGLLRPKGYAGYLTWNSTSVPRTLVPGLLELGC